jgi:hypothetical protein
LVVILDLIRDPCVVPGLTRDPYYQWILTFAGITCAARHFFSAGIAVAGPMPHTWMIVSSSFAPS